MQLYKNAPPNKRGVWHEGATIDFIRQAWRAIVVTTPSPAPPVIVAAWCIGVERMNRHSLDRFTRDIWKRFDHRDLEPLKWAIIRRRRVLAMQLRP